MFSLGPRKQALQNVQNMAVLVPDIKGQAFTFMPGLPESLLVLCGTATLLHLHTNNTAADSVLHVSHGGAAVVQHIALPLEHAAQDSWFTVLDVDPKLFIYAVLSKTGLLLFFKLRVRLVNETPSYEAEGLQHHQLPSTYKDGTSVCLQDKRYFFLKTADHALQVFQCDIKTFEVTEAENVPFVLQLMLRDYNTENNILGCKCNVVYYKREPIATVPVGYIILCVFGTQCNAFQLLVDNHGTVEWWRWTGAECEAVRLPEVQGVPSGNLLWF